MNKLLIARRLEVAAVAPPVKGTRVAVKYGPNEWYIGVVTRSGAKITVAFDDGSTEAHPWSALKIKAIAYKRVRKTPITDAQVKDLLSAVPPVKKASPPRAKNTTSIKGPVEADKASDGPAVKAPMVNDAEDMKSALERLTPSEKESIDVVSKSIGAAPALIRVGKYLPTIGFPGKKKTDVLQKLRSRGWIEITDCKILSAITTVKIYPCSLYYKKEYDFFLQIDTVSDLNREPLGVGVTSYAFRKDAKAKNVSSWSNIIIWKEQEYWKVFAGKDLLQSFSSEKEAKDWVATFRSIFK